MAQDALDDVRAAFLHGVASGDPLADGIRPTAPGDMERIYRAFRWGDLVDLIMLDTRLIGRERQVADECDRAQLDDPARSLLVP